MLSQVLGYIALALCLFALLFAVLVLKIAATARKLERRGVKRSNPLYWTHYWDEWSKW
jgi:hypothetical protein